MLSDISFKSRERLLSVDDDVRKKKKKVWKNNGKSFGAKNIVFREEKKMGVRGGKKSFLFDGFINILNIGESYFPSRKISFCF